MMVIFNEKTKRSKKLQATSGKLDSESRIM
jgi:hypothetical protein